MKRIKDGKHPHYRATTKHLTLSLPGALSGDEREALSQAILADAAAGRAAPSFDSGVGSGYASQDVVLAAFGLTRGDIGRVTALGEASRRSGSDEESDSASVDDDMF